MRFLLINPPIEGLCRIYKSRHVPTGLMYLAHALQRNKINVEIFDSLLWSEDTHVIPRRALSEINRKKVETNPVFKNIVHFGAKWERIGKVIERFQPDIVGITSSFSFHYPQAYLTAEIVRHACPRAKILMGGAHATIMWAHAFAMSPVDGIV